MEVENQENLTAETTDTTETSGAENNQLPDLSELAKFRWEGKDWTVDELRKATLLQSDYTRKTQALAEERKYAENLSYDLQAVMQNPALVAEFKRIYPTKYHALLDRFQPNTQPQAPGQSTAPTEYEQRLNQLENHFKQQEESIREAQVRSNEAAIDTLFTEMSKKYPLANELVVISQAQALIDQGIKLGDEKGNMDKTAWDKIWKSVQDAEQKRYESHYSKLVNNQKQASVKGRDVASGGGIPGQAPKKMTMKEATEHAIQTLTARNS